MRLINTAYYCFRVVNSKVSFESLKEYIKNQKKWAQTFLSTGATLVRQSPQWCTKTARRKWRTSFVHVCWFIASRCFAYLIIQEQNRNGNWCKGDRTRRCKSQTREARATQCQSYECSIRLSCQDKPQQCSFRIIRATKKLGCSQLLAFCRTHTHTCGEWKYRPYKFY